MVKNQGILSLFMVILQGKMLRKQEKEHLCLK